MNLSLNRASYEQQSASDPHRSVWVAANAGSGKTHVLVDRVIRLMLSGTAPDKILCITFTKAAAAEMASRLHGRLGAWVVLEDKELARHIDAMGHREVTADTLKRARELFTLALETPGGLKIQTIHAFCERLLQLFPVEAGVVPGFEVMDERSSAELLDQARRSVIGEAETRGDPALKRIVARAQAETFDELLRAILLKRSELSADLPYLRGQLGLGPNDSRASIENELLAIDVVLYGRLIAALDRSSGATDRKSAAALRRIEAGELEAFKDLFLTKLLKPRALASIASKKLCAAEPWIAEAFESESARVLALLGKRAALEMMEATEALVAIAARIIVDYERLKRLYGRYDFEDLILRTKRLLVEQVSSAWVLYKLDGGIDHILVDEAQDTSPAQWQIVKALAEEFFAGRGARGDVTRTIFVVGDRKQSIFSFQGADPTAFEEARRFFATRISEDEGHLGNVALNVSYRSTATVLDAVDAVFEQETARRGLVVGGDTDIQHEAVRKGHAGLVELWPVTLKDEKPEHDPWLVPVDRVDRNHPARKLARRIAETIADWLRSGRRIEALGRPVRPGDILILVRTRNDFFASMLREFNRLRIPVAGADRVTLNEHIAIQDLLALGQFIVLPEDDHALACLLKSPLISHPQGRAFDDDDLFALAHGRGRQSLWRRLAESAPLRPVHEKLRKWIAISAEESPFGFYARVLGEDMPSVRQNILSRLGPEAVDLIDAFLNLALDYEQRETPSLQGFLHWFTSADTEVRRDMDQSSDVVRIMTVHGAKGLEAPVVFLPDTCSPPDDRNEVQPLMIPAPEGKLIPFWRFGGGVEAREVTALRNLLREQRMDEYRRQLYVALTRARDELYICGYTSDEMPKAGSWYSLVEASLDGPRDAQGVLRLTGEQTAPLEIAPEASVAFPAAQMAPAWIEEKPPRELTGGDWVNPSRLLLRKAAGSAVALEQGRALHRLFQLLPDMPAERRRPLALQLLERRSITGSKARALVDRVLGIIEHPDHAAYFGENGLAEIPLVADLGEKGLLSGQVDRIVVTEAEILILDYKSDHAPPKDPGGVPEAYIAQLAAYRSGLARMFPHKTVTAALLWTETAHLMIIPPDLLARH
ncbi:MAG: double-strand break repair helicase AddA [Parvibaculaceae bacterium]